MLSGIPVKFINMIFYAINMPNNLYDYFQTYPYLVGIGTLFYFIVTVIVEYLYLRHVYQSNNDTSLKELFKPIYYLDFKSFFSPKKGEESKKHRKKLMRFVILVNVVSYAFMAPLNYYVTKPRHDIKEFTKDSSWAQQPASPVYYIDHKNRLAMIMTDGSEQQIISKKPTESYHIDDKDGKCYYSKKHSCHDENENTKVVVYWGLGSSINIDHKGKEIRLAINPGLLHLGRRWWDIALLPNGKELVFSDQKNIYLMNIEKRKVGTIAFGTNFMLKTQLFLKKGE
jgi:hypothetical protein